MATSGYAEPWSVNVRYMPVSSVQRDIVIVPVVILLRSSEAESATTVRQSVGELGSVISKSAATRNGGIVCFEIDGVITPQTSGEDTDIVAVGDMMQSDANFFQCNVGVLEQQTHLGVHDLSISLADVGERCVECSHIVI